MIGFERTSQGVRSLEAEQVPGIVRGEQQPRLLAEHEAMGTVAAGERDERYEQCYNDCGDDTAC